MQLHLFAFRGSECQVSRGIYFGTSAVNTRMTKRMRVAARLEELRHEFFPNGGESVMDANRMALAARHYFTAETSQDAVVAQRATRVAEYLLAKLRPPSAPRPSVEDPAAQALAFLLNGKPSA